MQKRRPFFAANWKMNKTINEGVEFFPKFKDQMGDLLAKAGSEFDVLFAPPATHLASIAPAVKGTTIWLGAQNSGIARSGAFTGENSPSILKDLGCTWVILGHSERRHVFKEDDVLVLTRVKAALEEGLSVILCVGEILQDRKNGRTFKVIESQLSEIKKAGLPQGFWDRIVIAYEPVWAIGTGETATPQQAQEVHVFIRQWIAEGFGSEQASKVRILYGGSVKPENSGQILAQGDVDGLLVGNASLDPAAFAGVIRNGLKS